MSARPPRIFYILVPLLSVLAALAAAELLLATFAPTPFAVERNMAFMPDPHTGYRLQPGGRGSFVDGIPGVANSDGHRDDELPVRRADSLRILALGDSFTVGANVRMEDTWPANLERRLQSEQTHPVDVINSGVGGWAPYQYAQYYEHYGRAFAPDVVLVGFFVGNDTYNKRHRPEQLRTAVLGRRVRRASAESPFVVPRVWLIEHSHLARRFLTPSARMERRILREHCADFDEFLLAYEEKRMKNHRKRDAERERNLENTLHQLARIQEMARADGAALLVVLIPDENQINPQLQYLLWGDEIPSDYDMDMPQVLLAEKFRETGVHVLDPLARFRGHPGCLYLNDTHFNAAGLDLLASAIQDEMRGAWPPPRRHAPADSR
jgi:hypothetical protein